MIKAISLHIAIHTLRSIVKLIPFVIFTMSGTQTKAQFRFSILAGVKNSKLSIKDYPTFYTEFIDSYLYNVNVKSKTEQGFTFFGGIKVDYDLTSNISISSKIMLDNTRLGQTYEQSRSCDICPNPLPDSLSGEDIINMLYATLPLHLVFYAPLKKSRLYIGVGGYLSYGFFGTNEFTYSYSSISSIRDSIMQITFSSDDKIKSASYHANRLDYGVSVIAGIQFRNRLFIEGGFDNGLNSVFKDRFLVYDQFVTNRGVIYSFTNRKREFRVGIGYQIK